MPIAGYYTLLHSNFPGGSVLIHLLTSDHLPSLDDNFANLNKTYPLAPIPLDYYQIWNV